MKLILEMCVSYPDRLGGASVREARNEGQLSEIAQVAPLFESISSLSCGGTKRVVFWITEELVRQGHEVTLFASGNLVM